jgi:hypothetical protein
MRETDYLIWYFYGGPLGIKGASPPNAMSVSSQAFALLTRAAGQVGAMTSGNPIVTGI